MRNKTNTIVWVLAALTALTACSKQQNADQATAASQSIERQAWTAIRNGALLIDVRTQGEFDQGHLPGAILIPHTQTDALVKEIGDDKDRAVVLYCRSGRRSGLATQTLQNLGFTNVVNGGGYQALMRAK